MATRENERWKSGGGKGRYDSESTLVLVHFDVPFVPDIGRGEHATATTPRVTSESSEYRKYHESRQVPDLDIRLGACSSPMLKIEARMDIQGSDTSGFMNFGTRNPEHGLKSKS